MKGHLSSLSENCSTENTNGSWYHIKKVRPKHIPIVSMGKIDKNGKIVSDQVGVEETLFGNFYLASQGEANKTRTCGYTKCEKRIV